MDISDIQNRYRLLLEEMKRRMTRQDKWAGLPGLLDELYSLRRQYETCIGRSPSVA